MKIRSITIRVPAPRASDDPRATLRRRLASRSSTADLRRRLRDIRRA